MTKPDSLPIAIPIAIRPATADDVPTLTRFILEEAREAEGRALDPALVARGVRAGVLGGAVAGYWVAEDRATGEILGSTSVYTEWSDWSAAPYWWIQSFYVVPPARGRGLSLALVSFLEEEAVAAGAVELRLYAHSSNKRALAAYRRAGFSERPYTILGKPVGAAERSDKADTPNR